MTGVLKGHAIMLMTDFEANIQQYKVMPVYDDALGPLRIGPDTDGYNIAGLDPVAVAPNGLFAVMQIAGGDLGLFLWDSAAETFGPAPTDTLTLPGGNAPRAVAISPDSLTLIVGSGGMSPFVEAYPVSVAGFGSPYSAPGTLPDGGVDGVHWHPSGMAIALTWGTGAIFGAGVWAWSGGWGSKYADPADAPVGGCGAVPRFNPEGTHLFVPRGGDVAVGGFRIYEFDLGSGLGAKLADSASPAASVVGAWMSDFNGSIVAAGPESPHADYAFYTYSFEGGVIGPAVGYHFNEAFDEYAGFLHFASNYLLVSVDYGIVQVFHIEADGTLTPLGPFFVDVDSGGWCVLGWRPA